MDVALLVIMAYFLLRGIFRGVVKEIVAVLGIFIAFWVAGLYWPIGDEHLRGIFDSPGHRGVVSFIIIFSVVYFLIGIISIFVDKIVKITISPIVSSLLGAVVGCLKGLLVCAVLLAMFTAFIKPDDAFFTKSELWPHIAPISKKVKEIMPVALKRAMEAKRSLPPVNARYRLDQGENNSGGASLAPSETPLIDWPIIKNILAAHPGEVSPSWRDKIRNLPDNQPLNAEEIKRFIADHPDLFNKAGASALNAESLKASPPTWPQPAGE